MPVPQKQKPTTPRSTRTTPSSGVLSRIKPIGFDEADGLKLLLYGRSGTGKTTLWATFPGPILAIIASGGNKTGELRSIDTPEYRDKISAVTLHNSGEMKELVELAKGGEYATVVLDHASGLQDLILKEVLNLDELPAQKSWGMARQQDYGQTAAQAKEYLRALLNLDCNVVVVAQEREYKDEGNGEVIQPFVCAYLMPSILAWLHPAVDYIGETFIRQKEITKETKIGSGKDAKILAQKVKVKGQVEYCLRTAPDPVYATKFRVPKGSPLPDVLVDPTYDSIYGLIKGE